MDGHFPTFQERKSEMENSFSLSILIRSYKFSLRWRNVSREWGEITDLVSIRIYIRIFIIR